MKKGVVWLLSEDDILEIYAACALHMLKGHDAGLSTQKVVTEMPEKVLAFLRENCTTD